MKRLWVILPTACLALSAMSAAAQMTVVYAKPLHAQRPAGVVVDATGAAIPGAKVESCRAHWDDCVDAGTTDARGEFDLSTAQQQKRYYLRFTAYGFDPLEIELRLRPFAKKDLVATMKIAT